MRDTSTPSVAPLPGGMTAIGIFLLFGALMASLAGSTLVWHGTVLDRMWTLNLRAYSDLAPLGQPMGLLFLSLAVALALAGTGWLQRRRWAWRLAVVIIGTQVLGDAANFLYGSILQGVVGVTIACPVLIYMTRPHVRAVFLGKPKPIVHTASS